MGRLQCSEIKTRLPAERLQHEGEHLRLVLERDGELGSFFQKLRKQVHHAWTIGSSFLQIETLNAGLKSTERP